MRSFPKVSASIAVAVLLLGAGVAFAWTGPSEAPTGGNVAAPVNVGSTAQTKSGTLGVNGLAVFGNTLLSGSSRYLNWGTTAGDSGYGLRDNGGTIQYKNSGGNWTSFSGGGTWTTSGDDIYAANSGNVGIGVTNPSQKLVVSGTVLATAFLYSSDARLKEGISALQGGLAKILALAPVSFTWKEDISTANAGRGDIGFIAQDVEAILPEVVTTDAHGMKSVDYVRVVPVLVKAIQEQQEEIDMLKADIAALKAAE